MFLVLLDHFRCARVDTGVDLWELQHHAQQGQVGRGQSGGRLYAWLSQQRGASERRGFTTQVPVREAGVSRTVTGRGGVLS